MRQALAHRFPGRRGVATLALLLAVAVALTACGGDEFTEPAAGEDPIEEEVWLANYLDVVGEPAAVEEDVEELGGEVVAERETIDGTVTVAWFPSRSLDELEGYRSGLADRGVAVSRITRDEVQEIRELLD